MEKLKLKHISFDITNKCNLSCYGCNHFMPLVTDYWFMDINYLQTILNELENKFIIEDIIVAGGEPTLHPELINILRLIRNTFKDAKIEIVTNGLLLKNWVSYKDDINNLKIYIHISPYKIISEENLHLYMNSFQYLEIDDNKYLTKKGNFFTTAIDLKGNNDYKSNFIKCRNKSCNKIKNDYKIYRCPIMMNLYTLTDYFNRQVDIEECERGIDIRKASAHEILDFLTNPNLASSCRFCNYQKIKKFTHTWSNKNESEWLAEE